MHMRQLLHGAELYLESLERLLVFTECGPTAYKFPCVLFSTDSAHDLLDDSITAPTELGQLDHSYVTGL